MVHAAESMHWYTREGLPAYTVKSRDGTDRPATLRDARKIGLVPSVTEIIKSCHKPGLERWKLDQMLHSALTLPRLAGESEGEWISRVWSDSKETARKAAERGTTIHAALQGYWQHEPTPPEYMPHIQGACDAMDEAFKLDPDCAMVEQSFASPLGFGGKVDFGCTSPNLIVDFKTKEFGPDADLKTWDEHSMQLAAYRHGFQMPDARCAIVYVSVTHPGVVRLIEIPPDQLTKGWNMFQGLLAYWKAKNNLETGWIEEEAA